MSMYDLVAGDGQQQSRGAVLLAMLGNPDPGRFRDAWVERGQDGEPVIAIYTRNGGGNRECYCEDVGGDSCTGCIGAAFARHPLCFRDVDDDTYATYYFHSPPEYRDLLAGVMGDPVDMGARWQAAIDAIRP